MHWHIGNAFKYSRESLPIQIAFLDLQDRFQASFWKLRQSEYEPYLLQRSPLRTKQVRICSCCI